MHVAKEEGAGDADKRSGTGEHPSTSQSIQLDDWSTSADETSTLSPPVSPAVVRRHHSLDTEWLSRVTDENDSRLNSSSSGVPATSPTHSRTQFTAVGRLYLDPPRWPLEDVEDATLLQHFINEVALFVRQSHILPTPPFHTETDTT